MSLAHLLPLLTQSSPHSHLVTSSFSLPRRLLPLLIPSSPLSLLVTSSLSSPHRLLPLLTSPSPPSPHPFASSLSSPHCLLPLTPSSSPLSPRHLLPLLISSSTHIPIFQWTKLMAQWLAGPCVVAELDPGCWCYQSGGIHHMLILFSLVSSPMRRKAE